MANEHDVGELLAIHLIAVDVVAVPMGIDDEAYGFVGELPNFVDERLGRGR